MKEFKNLKFYKVGNEVIALDFNDKMLRRENGIPEEDKDINKSDVKIIKPEAISPQNELLFLLDNFSEPTKNVDGGNRYNKSKFLKAIKNLKGFDTDRKFYYCFNPVEYKNYNSWFLAENINSKLLAEYIEGHQQLYEGRNKEQIMKDDLLYTNKPPHKKPALFFDYDNEIYPIATNEDLTVIGADIGIGKSRLIQLVATGLLKEKINPSANFDSLNMKFTKVQGVIVHFDTEMSHDTADKRVKFHTEKRLNITREHLKGNYSFKMLKRFGAEERIEEIDLTLKAINNLYGEVGAVLIDGLGDLTTDKNSSEGASLLQEYIDKWSIIYNCPIIGTMHYNPSRKNFGTDEKLSGHLGTKLESKAETVIGITIDKKGEMLLQFKKTRDSNSYKAPQVKYKYNEVGIPEFIEYDNSIKLTPEEIIFQATMDVLTANAGEPINQTKLLKEISEITDYSAETLRQSYIDTIRGYPKVTHRKKGKTYLYVLEGSEGTQVQIPT